MSAIYQLPESFDPPSSDNVIELDGPQEGIDFYVCRCDLEVEFEGTPQHIIDVGLCPDCYADEYE